MIARRRFALVAVAASAGLSAPGSAGARVAAPKDGDPTIPEAARHSHDDRIHFDITPDLWGLSIKAQGSFGGMPVAASVPLGSIIKHLDNLFLGQVDVRKGHLVLLIDVTHASITLPARAPLPSGYRLPISATFLTLGAGYSSGPIRLGTIDARPVVLRVEPFAGATFDDLDAEVDGPQGKVAGLAPTWWSLMVGSRVDIARGRSSLRAEGYVTGFSHARSGQQALASYAYRLKWHALRDPTLGGGYRYSHQRRAVNSDSLDLRLQGPVVYMTFHL